MKTLLVDGDVVLYEVTTSVEEAICWGDDFWTLHADMKVARGKLNANLAELKKTLKADNMIIALSDVGKNFRKNLSPDYKKHRKKMVSPTAYSSSARPPRAKIRKESPPKKPRKRLPRKRVVLLQKA